MNKKKVTIERSEVWSRISEPKLVDSHLRYRAEYWFRAQYRKVKKVGRVRLVTKDGFFLTGFVPRVCAILKKKKVPYVIIDKYTSRAATLEPKEPKVKGVTFRPDQETALKKILSARSGHWQAPTRSGKTVLAAGLISAYPKCTSLFLVHTKDLLMQTYEAFVGFFGAKEVGILGASKKVKGRITVATRQTLRSNIKDFVSTDIIIVDEAHHVAKINGEYPTILKQLKAAIRVGFTATPPKDEESKLALEGYIGKFIGQTTEKELYEANILAKPKMKLLLVPENDKLKGVKGGYISVYDANIVNYRKRNMMIVEEAVANIKQGKSVLIIIEKLEHGENLMDMFKIKVPKVFTFLKGSSTIEKRMKEKLDFTEKKRKGVVASRIWVEGVSIMTVDVVINAVGGQSEIAVFQKLGRGLGKAEGKEEVLLVDFIDLSHTYMQRHSLKRVCYFYEKGWLS